MPEGDEKYTDNNPAVFAYGDTAETQADAEGEAVPPQQTQREERPAPQQAPKQPKQ